MARADVPRRPDLTSVVDDYMRRAGLERLPSSPHERLPPATPTGPPGALPPAPGELVDRAKPEAWCTFAADFAAAYPGLTLTDPTLAQLADPRRARTAGAARGGRPLAQALARRLVDARAALKAAVEDTIVRDAIATADAAALDDPATRRDWRVALVAEFRFPEAHVVWLQRLAGRVQRAADPRNLDAPTVPDRDADRHLGSLGHVAYVVAEYLAAHHRKARRVWADVVRVLEFYEWELGAGGLRFKADALRHAAGRYAHRAPRRVASKQRANGG